LKASRTASFRGRSTWKATTFSGGIFPRNFRTGKPYRGVNVMLLWSTDYSSPFWLTFKQAQELGGTVRKGEKSQQIVFYKQLRNRTQQDNSQPTENQGGTEKKERVPFVLTYYNVFNVEQVRRPEYSNCRRSDRTNRS
jgi:antirestriction protein ArdC